MSWLTATPSIKYVTLWISKTNNFIYYIDYKLFQTNINLIYSPDITSAAWYYNGFEVQIWRENKAENVINHQVSWRREGLSGRPVYWYPVLTHLRREHIINYYALLHLARKYARIFVRGHYLFREANSFPRAKLEENCELRGTDNVQGQISEHIFEAKWRLL